MLITCLLQSAIVCLPACLPACLPNRLPACPPACISVFRILLRLLLPPHNACLIGCHCGRYCLLTLDVRVWSGCYCRCYCHCYCCGRGRLVGRDVH